MRCTHLVPCQGRRALSRRQRLVGVEHEPFSSDRNGVTPGRHGSNRGRIESSGSNLFGRGGSRAHGHGAYLMHQDTELGELSIGMLADLIVVDQDIFAIPSQDIWKQGSADFGWG